MIYRVVVPGRPFFQLRKGEEGISKFDSEAVSPPLTQSEVLDCFKPGSAVIERLTFDIEKYGLRIVPIEGTEPLSERLRKAHAEIRPRSGMTRSEFKMKLKELE